MNYPTNGRKNTQLTFVVFPTNIASVHLVMGCPIARAGVKIVGGKKGTIRATWCNPNSTPLLITTSGVAAGVALVAPILVG